MPLTHTHLNCTSRNRVTFEHFVRIEKSSHYFCMELLNFSHFISFICWFVQIKIAEICVDWSGRVAFVCVNCSMNTWTVKKDGGKRICTGNMKGAVIFVCFLFVRTNIFYVLIFASQTLLMVLWTLNAIIWKTKHCIIWPSLIKFNQQFFSNL